MGLGILLAGAAAIGVGAYVLTKKGSGSAKSTPVFQPGKTYRIYIFTPPETPLPQPDLYQKSIESSGFSGVKVYAPGTIPASWPPVPQTWVQTGVDWHRIIGVEGTWKGAPNTPIPPLSYVYEV